MKCPFYCQTLVFFILRRAGENAWNAGYTDNESANLLFVTVNHTVKCEGSLSCIAEMFCTLFCDMMMLVRGRLGHTHFFVCLVGFYFFAFLGEGSFEGIFFPY